jgi:hypothetical protein
MFSHFGFFQPKITYDSYEDELAFIYMDLNNTKKNKTQTLTFQQKLLYNDILKETYDNNSKSKLFYINGFGGSGKTYFYNTSFLQLEKKEI